MGALLNFETLQSTGSFLLLSILLLVSMFIAWKQGIRIKTTEMFLFATGEMKPHDFAFSEAAYMIAVGTTLLFLSALTYIYGTWFIVVIVLSFFAGMFFYKEMTDKGDMPHFFQNTGAHLGEYIIRKTGSRIKSETALLSIISLFIFLTFFGYFIIEIVALRVFAGSLGNINGVEEIIGGATTITIMYVVVGGYQGTFKTDILQTSFITLAILLILGYSFATVQTFPNRASIPFMTKSVAESIALLISYTILTIATLITGLDIWARMRAIEGQLSNVDLSVNSANAGKAGKGIILASFLTAFLFAAICCFGILALVLDLKVDQYQVVSSVITTIGIPSGLFLVLLLVLGISTADTSLITTVQAIEPFLRSKLTGEKSLNHIRYVILIIGIIGLLVAVSIPPENIMQLIYITITLPVSFTPLVLIRRYSRRKAVRPLVGFISILISCILGFVICISSPQYADFSALIILFCSFSIYYSLAIMSRLFKR